MLIKLYSSWAIIDSSLNSFYNFILLSNGSFTLNFNFDDAFLIIWLFLKYGSFFCLHLSFSSFLSVFLWSKLSMLCFDLVDCTLECFRTENIFLEFCLLGTFNGILYSDFIFKISFLKDPFFREYWSTFWVLLGIESFDSFLGVIFLGREVSLEELRMMLALGDFPCFS